MDPHVERLGRPYGTPRCQPARGAARGLRPPLDEGRPRPRARGGACTVIVDGRAVVSCAQPAARAQAGTCSRSRDFPRTSARPYASGSSRRAPSSGFCSPGIVMKAEALLRRDPAPGATGSSARSPATCVAATGYLPIVTAIEEVAALREASRSRRRRPRRCSVPTASVHAPPATAPRTLLPGPAVRGRHDRERHAPRRGSLQRPSASRSADRHASRGAGAGCRGRPRSGSDVLGRIRA